MIAARTFHLSALLVLAAASAQAASPPCAVAGRAPSSLQLLPAEIADAAPTINLLNWSEGQQLQIVEVRRLTGACRNDVLGFAGHDVLLRGNLVSTWNDAGEFSAAKAAGPTPAVPLIPEVEHDDHAHGGTELGDFVGGSRIAVGPESRSANQYFVGVWRPMQRSAGAAKQPLPGATLAVYARTREGIFSGAAPLLRSTRTVRAVTYLRGDDAESGRLGILQEDGDALVLVTLAWKHRDYSR